LSSTCVYVLTRAVVYGPPVSFQLYLIGRFFTSLQSILRNPLHKSFSRGWHLVTVTRNSYLKLRHQGAEPPSRASEKENASCVRFEAQSIRGFLFICLQCPNTMHDSVSALAKIQIMGLSAVTVWRAQGALPSLELHYIDVYMDYQCIVV
jgi:hypothetical protein